MSLKEEIERARKLLANEFKPAGNSSVSKVGSLEFSISEIPRIKEEKNKDWVSFGDNNLYPLQISDLKYGSPIHNAIVSTAGDMISGDGFLFDGAKTKEESDAKYAALSPEIKAKYDSFLKNENDSMTLEEIDAKISFDFKEQGACAVEIIYNTAHDTISRIKYVDVKNLRAGKMDGDIIKWWYYSKDWKDSKKGGFNPRKIAAFDPKNKEAANQIAYLKRGSLEYYGEPDYAGALTWIQTDFQMGIYHLSNLENGMNPSLHLQFYELPRDEEDKQRILSEIRRSFVGANKTGKHMVSFSDGTALAPKYEPLQVNNLDKQLLLLAELCDRKILTGHKLTSPLLAGISVSGQLGGNTEIEKAFNIYDKTRISPYRKLKDAMYNNILEINGVTFKIQTNPYNPFIQEDSGNPVTNAINTLSPLVANKVLESMTANEIRALIGLDKTNVPTGSNIIK